ncbi:2,3-bisphosphoglycerate-independent phosphoglycerate mutase [Candidatus Bipolaricaulota bacterium]|nr:2,3-bisphosphoglycerate-independent phosphoglycerate mutase [Candidatus Bipolaricaulota bacterium]
MKGVFIIADGLGGRPSDLAGKTCLEAARTPNLDELARRGAIGLIDPIRPGVRPGSDTAHLSLLGYDPYEVYTGRGVYECLGIGIDVEPGDVCFRANFATVEETPDGLKLLDRRAGRIESGQEALAQALTQIELSDGVKFAFKASTQHRGALRLRGEGLTRHVSENDPHKTGVVIPDAQPLSDEPGARRTAAAVNEFTRKSYEVLKDHPVNRERIAAGKPPANIVLLRGAADLPHLEPIAKVYKVRGAVIAGAALYRGVALACGMTRIDAPGATGGVDTDLVSKAKTAIEALNELDYVFIHVKGTDNKGHDQDAEGKMRFIERIDAELIGTLMEKLDWSETHLAFTGDHTTPIDYGDHTAEPVPILYVGPNVRTDATTEFGERAAGRGGLGRWSGRALPILFNYNNWAPKFGS